MRGLCGWFGQVEGDAVQVLRRMLGSGSQPSAEPISRADPQHGLAVFGDIARPRLYAADGIALVVAGHPRWIDGQSRSENLAALAAALRMQGSAALSRLGGDFSLAAWDERERRGWLAIDRIGVHQLVYARNRGVLAFASTLDMLAAHPGIERRLSRQGLYDYLYFHVCPGPGTIYEGMSRVPAGHFIEFGDGKVSPPRPYWTMRFDEEPGRDLGLFEEEFLTLTRAAVAEAAEAENTGAFLSGGTDSSTVSGMLGRVSKKPARTFSIGFDAAGYDEMEYARIAARHFGCEHHEYYVTPNDVVAAIPKIAASYDQPFGNASAIPTYYCAKLAREHGIERLLAGDGGDELFGGNERYAKQHLLGLYGSVPSILKSAVIEPLLRAMPGVDRFAPTRKLRSYVEQARPPMPQRYQSYNLLSYLGQDKVFTPEFLASIDPGHSLALMQDAHTPFADASLINQMLAIDLRFILADGDLPKVTRTCALAGVDVTFPLLDDRLVAFSGRLPARMKLRGTQLRWFFKHALRDFLPPQILKKQKHGFGLPVGTWLVGHKPLADLANDSVRLLRDRGIVQPRFIDELFSTRLREHPGYFGTMIWVLMMLGLWLDSRRL
jgi:asparagine synthase (glutamine-hydrolysing)